MSDNNSTEKLIERIISDASDEATKILAEAKDKANEIAKLAERDATQILMDGEAQSQRAENDILTKARTNAALEARKFDLKMRRKLIDTAFLSALERLRTLQGNELREFLCALIVNEADGGEVVHPCALHKVDVERVLEQANDKLKAVGKQPLSLGEVVELSSGFKLSGKGYTKVCSFEELLDDLKEKEITNVAGKLFV